MNKLIMFRGQTSVTRLETFEGRSHLAVPVIAIVEGVIQASNAPAPELALAEEFGKAPAAWNGRPVVVNHPRDDNGEMVSANSPLVLQAEQIGHIFNARLLDDKKLSVEAWIDTSRTTELGGRWAATVERLEAGEVVEVSIGAFMSLEKEPGRFNGQDYSGIWRDVLPDHLALLEEGTVGACSVEDGCGAPRTMNAATVCDCGLACKCEENNVTNVGKLVSTHSVDEGDPPADGSTSSDEPKVAESAFRSIAKRLGGIFRVGNTDVRVADTEGLSDIDRRHAIQSALDASGGSFKWLVAVFDGQIVFETWDGLFETTFEIAEDGSVTIGEEAVATRPVTQFVNVKITKENAMNKDERVTELIANSRTSFTDDDKAWLIGLEDAQLDKLVPPAEIEADPVVAKEIGTEPQTLEAYVGAAPTEIAEVLNEGVRMLNERRNNLVAALAANSKCAFSQDELRVMSTDALVKTAALAQIDDFSGRGIPVPERSANDGFAPAPPRLIREVA